MNHNSKSAYDRFSSKLAGKASRITPHVLVLESKMSTTETALKFILEQDNGTGVNSRTENRLGKNDLFQVASIGMFLAAPTDKDDVIYRVATYPNPLIFPTTSAAMEAIYKGHLKVTVDNDVALDKWSVFQHLFVPRVQDTTGASTIRDNMNGNRDGFVSLFPGIVFAGNRNTDISLILPKALTALEPGKEPRVILRLEGFLATNATSYLS
jgi:hypothetical protein